MRQKRTATGNRAGHRTCVKIGGSDQDGSAHGSEGTPSQDEEEEESQSDKQERKTTTSGLSWPNAYGTALRGVIGKGRARRVRRKWTATGDWAERKWTATGGWAEYRSCTKAGGSDQGGSAHCSEGTPSANEQDGADAES